MALYAKTAFPADTISNVEIQQAIAQGVPWTPADAAEVFGEDLSNHAPREIVIAGEHFVYDPNDTTSAHDPDGGVLVSNNGAGKRFLSVVAPTAFVSVLSRIDAQPASPSIGDKHIVGLAPTGDDFTGNANKLARYTSAGWKFRMPVIGEATYNRATQSEWRWTASGSWLDEATTAAEAIGLNELKHKFGVVVEGEIDRVPAAQIAQATGSALGDMTADGGLAALFDETDTQIATACASKAATTEAYAGKTYTTAQVFAYVEVISSSDLGFLSGAAGNISFELRGLQGVTPPTAADDGVLLGVAGAVEDADSQTTIRIGVGSSFIKTAYEHAWVRVISSVSGTLHVAEVKFYTPNIVAAETLYIVAANPIGALAGQSTKVAEADGSGGWVAFYTPAEESTVNDRAAQVTKVFRGGVWDVSGGSLQGFKRTGETGTDATTLHLAGESEYQYSPTTAPTTSRRRRADDKTITYTAKTGSVLRFRYQAVITVSESNATGGPTVMTAALFRDSETEAIDWVPLGKKATTEAESEIPSTGDIFAIDVTMVIPDADALAHTYKMAIMSGHHDTPAERDLDAALQRRNFTLEEFVESV